MSPAKKPPAPTTPPAAAAPVGAHRPPAAPTPAPPERTGWLMAMGYLAPPPH